MYNISLEFRHFTHAGLNISSELRHFTHAGLKANQAQRSYLTWRLIKLDMKSNPVQLLSGLTRDGRLSVAFIGKDE